VLIISGISVVALPEGKFNNENLLIKSVSIKSSDPIITDNGKYLSISLDESESLLLDTGKPVIPVLTKTLTFPYGTNIISTDIKCNYEEYILQKKIQPSPEPVVLSNRFSPKIKEVMPDELVYSKSDFYPSQTYSVKMGAGLKGEEHVLYVNIRCYSQYSPNMDKIKIPSNIDIAINYILPETSLLSADEYDMLIITDEKFESQLQTLVNHKNNNGIRTILETTQDIYPMYNGVDDAEDIKLRIKDAIEDWGISYVLLAGGRKGQTWDWYIPERRTNTFDDSFESGYSSDLYYADIYKANGEFDNWDSNGNGIFAEFSPFGSKRDYMDYYPDVYIGRIPLRYSWEADIIIEKIITYETSADDSWFKQAYVISGDTSPPARGNVEEGVYEGEISTGITADMLEDIGFNVERLWTSDGSWDSKEDVTNAISSGSGFIHFAGHGNPSSWVNFLPDAQTEKEKVDGFKLLDMRKYSNGEKLPIVVVGGCHNAQFNVTMQHLIDGLYEFGLDYLGHSRFWYMEWVPTDTCSWFMLEEGGGTIASIGNTGLGYGYVNSFCTEGLGGWINPRFFQTYAVQNIDILGQAHSQAIIDYLNIIFGDLSGQEDVDRKTIEEWILLGDPTLKIGGI
jgi:hypothetical protein